MWYDFRMGYSKRQKQRDVTCQILYACDYGEQLPGELVDLLRAPDDVVETSHHWALSIMAFDGKWRRIIQDHVRDYSLERIGKMEWAILRLLLSEQEGESPPPLAVLHAEGGRLSAKFASLESVRFVQAILFAALDCQERCLKEG
ncbi:MAG: hypothetical protein VXZ72_04710 [Chlamydiota bacterium]|nr:hypothetical protein [Chlamydiota bacterium]